MRRVAVRVAYFGNDFHGSQYQPGFRTVMGDMIRDLERIGGGATAEWFDLKTAGRTDRGVNALNNVAVFNTEFDDDEELLRALNSVSKGIFYRSITEVDASFNPRHADERVYRYILRSEGIDFKRARECSELFLGEHDFVRFCKPDGKPTVMEMGSIEMTESDGYITLTFRSRHFLWNMIRKIVAAISSVGADERDLNDVRRALDGETINFGMARPDALTLTDVVYRHIEFKEPQNKGYRDRIEEEEYSSMVRKGFFSSL